MAFPGIAMGGLLFHSMALICFHVLTKKGCFP